MPPLPGWLRRRPWRSSPWCGHREQRGRGTRKRHRHALAKMFWSGPEVDEIMMKNLKYTVIYIISILVLGMELVIQAL